jgi:predicted alpha/beta superfamily hydrolase
VLGQPRLADPGLAADQHDAPLAGEEALDPRAHALEDAGPPVKTLHVSRRRSSTVTDKARTLPAVRFLRKLWLALLAACGSNGATTPIPDAGLVPIRFLVHAPESTPAGASLYLAGNLSNSSPASPAHRLAETAPRTYELTLPFAPHTKLEFKVTRGSWETVERGPRGEEIANRTFEVLAETTLDLAVGSWADVSLSTITGDVTTFSLPAFLDGRRVWVYLPPGYHESTARYPVLYMFDAQNLFDRVTSFAGSEWRVDETLQQLIPAGALEPIIVVAVDHGGAQRIHEYTPWPDTTENRGGGGGAHLAAFADVLVPHIDATYRTRPGPASTAIAGSSLGGLMSLYAIYARPGVFGRAAALSPTIGWANQMIVSFIAAGTKPAARVWTDMGVNEYEGAVTLLRALRDALVAQGFVLGVDLQVLEDPQGGHNEPSWARRFPDVVRFLFPPP